MCIALAFGLHDSTDMIGIKQNSPMVKPFGALRHDYKLEYSYAFTICSGYVMSRSTFSERMISAEDNLFGFSVNGWIFTLKPYPSISNNWYIETRYKYTYNCIQQNPTTSNNGCFTFHPSNPGVPPSADPALPTGVVWPLGSAANAAAKALYLELLLGRWSKDFPY